MQDRPTSVNFPTTQWTHLASLQELPIEERRQALTEFVTRYQPAIQSYIRAAMRSVTDSDAEEYAQGFTVDKLIIDDILREVDRSKGRLRSLLRVVAERYCVDKIRKSARRASREAKALKESRQSSSNSFDPGAAFEASWVQTIVKEGIERTRHHFTRQNRQETWRILDARVIRPLFECVDPVSLDALEIELGQDRRTIRNLQVTAKRALMTNLRRVIAEYTDSQLSIDDELAYLQTIANSLSQP